MPLHLRNADVPIPPTHWLGEDGKVCLITLQGQLLVWKELQQKPTAPQINKRGQVMIFSRDSRLRLLKLLATIDWSRAEPTLFATLTYPDTVTITSAKQMNTHRYLFIRDLEKDLGKQIAVIWRIEWKSRRSGKNKGKYYPHFHLMIFNVSYIAYDTVNSLWKKAIGVNQYVRTEIKEMVNPAQCGYYVAKYCAKETDCSLVNAAYLNTVPPGRQWGLLRPSLLPREKERSARLTREQAAKALEVAEMARPCIKGTGKSFTILGPTAKEVGKKIFDDTT
jgi:hypothetical protein